MPYTPIVKENPQKSQTCMFGGHLCESDFDCKSCPICGKAVPIKSKSPSREYWEMRDKANISRQDQLFLDSNYPGSFDQMEHNRAEGC